MNSRKIIPHAALFEEVREILAQARRKAYAAVNFAMVEAYWEIGRRIVEEEQKGRDRAEYGAALIKELSKQLTSEFGKGFAVANIWNFRQFYLTFPDEKLYALRRELTWTHYRLIMRVESEAARDYYIEETAEQGWSTRQLERNINTLYYERLLKSSNKKALKQKDDSEKAPPRRFYQRPLCVGVSANPGIPLRFGKSNRDCHY